MFRKASVAVVVALVGACATPLPKHTPPIKLIEFRVLGVHGFQGVLAISESPLSRDEVLRFEQAIRVFIYHRSSPPRDLNACFYIDNHRYGLTRVTKESNGSYLLQLEYMVDAGVSYRFALRPDGNVSGSGGFWGGVGSDGTDDVEDKIVGTYKLAANIDACTNKFPPNGT